MTIWANHVGWLQRFIISVDSFHFNSETMRYCILMYSAESLAPKSILQPLVKLPMLVLGPMIFVDPLYQGISPTENNHMAITVGKSPHFSHIGMLHRFNPKPFFHCQPFLSFSSSCIYVGCFEEPPWLSDLKMCSVRFVIEVPVFSVKTHTSLAVSGNSYTYSTLFSTCRLDDIWMYQKQLWKLSKKNRQIYITQYSPVRACSWAIKL